MCIRDRTNPANTSAGPVGCGRQDTIEAARHNSTNPPTARENPRAGSIATASAPSTVPGARPAIAYPVPRQSMSSNSRRIASTDRINEATSSGTGTSSGSMMASSGAASRFIPRPALPCTTAPTNTTKPAMTSTRTGDTSALSVAPSEWLRGKPVLRNGHSRPAAHRQPLGGGAVSTRPAAIGYTRPRGAFLGWPCGYRRCRNRACCEALRRSNAGAVPDQVRGPALENLVPQLGNRPACESRRSRVVNPERHSGGNTVVAPHPPR